MGYRCLYISFLPAMESSAIDIKLIKHFDLWDKIDRIRKKGKNIKDKNKVFGPVFISPVI